MLQPHYAKLLALARRWSRRADEAEDLVHDALLVALAQGRCELGDAANRRWIGGIIRNSACMWARTAARRRRRDAAWLSTRDGTHDPEFRIEARGMLDDLPPGLKSVAALVLSGHNRREIAYLLRISDDVLRQRILTLKRLFVRRGASMPDDHAGLGFDLAYGRIRQTLLPGLRRHGGVLATHDPDGHLFYVSAHKSPAGGNIGRSGKPGDS